jgi:hypothetical protein
VEELLAKTLNRPSLLDDFTPHIHQRFHEGCTDTATLTAEIRTLGYRGSERTVYRYVLPFRPSRKASQPAPAAPKIRASFSLLRKRILRTT